MSSHATDGGDVSNSFDPEVVESDADLAEAVRKGDVSNVRTVMEETGAVLLRLESTYWGNEAFGVWSEWFFVKPDNVSPSGKALFVNEGIATRDALSRLRGANSVRERRGGLTSEAARKIERKAYDWHDQSQKPGPGMPPTDEREDSFRNASVPLSVVRYAVRLPESEEDTVVETNGATHAGKMSEGDIQISGAKADKYGQKLVLTGDTYDLLSSNGENLSGEMSWDDTHCTFDGDDWVLDRNTEAVREFVRVLTENGHKVSVEEDYAALLPGGVQ